MPHLFDYPLAIVDVETTGTSYTHGGVIDVGVLRVEQGRVVATYQQLINPGSRIPSFITQLTGIANEDLAEAPAFADISDQLLNLLDDCVFVAHNARFDYAFIKEEFRRLDIRFAPKTFCTVKLSRGLYPQFRHHKLDALIERFDIHIENRHRAFGDAQATWQALERMVRQAPPELLEHIVKQQLKQPTLPPQLSKETIDLLPETPGVYIFENSTGAILYVGKSVNIRSRVLSHFSDDVRSSKELTMAQEVAHIRTISTAGELGALLKESELIKSLMPIYNRMLRRKSELVLAIENQNADGFPTVRLGRYGQEDIGSGALGLESNSSCQQSRPQPLGSSPTSVVHQQILAVFRSEREAKESLISLAKEHGLCHKLLGLEKTKGSCFAHHLGRCHGACIGKESALSYRLRFDQAFASMRLQRWPFDGPIMVNERAADGMSSSGFILDQWRLVATIEQRDQEITINQTPSQFDLDQYKILRQFLSKSSARSSAAVSIRPLKQREMATYLTHNQ